MVALLLSLVLALPGAATAAKRTPDIDPAWSHDGKRIAFARLRSEGPVDTSASIWVVGRDGRGLREVTPDLDPSYFNRPAWSPDGVWLSIQVSARSSQPGVDVVRTAGGDLIPVKDETGSSTVEALDSAWSPDGGQLALGGVSGVHVADRDVWQARSLGGGNYPAWSPDGNRIVSTLGNATAIVDVSSGVETTLPAPPALASWSPDGTLIAYANGCQVGVVSASATGTPLRRRPCGENTTASAPSWSPDGRRFVYSRCVNSACGVYVAPATQPSKATKIARGTNPVWSPDGSRIAYARSVGNRFTGIWLIFSNGAGAWPLLR